MVRIQLLMPDEDRARFTHQARSEGMSLSAWLRAAAHERLARRSSADRFATLRDVEDFFLACDQREGPGEEPDWEQHLAVIGESRSRGASTR